MRKVLIAAWFFLFSLGLLAQVSLERINGFNVMPAFNPVEIDYSTEIVETGAEWVSLVTYIYANHDLPVLGYDNRPQKWGETFKGLRKMIAYAKDAQLKVMLKPSVWIPNVGWPGDLSFDDKGWEIWEERYRAYMLEVAALCETEKVDLLCIGTELKESVRNRPEFWLELINAIKCVYSGKLTYSSNWDNYRAVGFWSELDYIGVNAYFPLSSKGTPTKEELDKAWKPVIKELRATSQAIDRPVLFTEYGYRSIDSACGRQWEFERVRNGEAPPNFETQIIGYQSIFDTFWNVPWFAGGFIWHWKVEQEDYDWQEDNGYSPKDKPVVELLQKYFQGVLVTDQ